MPVTLSGQIVEAAVILLFGRVVFDVIRRVWE
jgi:hypothetical protein